MCMYGRIFPRTRLRGGCTPLVMGTRSSDRPEARVYKHRTLSREACEWERQRLDEAGLLDVAWDPGHDCAFCTGEQALCCQRHADDLEWEEAVARGALPCPDEDAALVALMAQVRAWSELRLLFLERLKR